MQHRRLLLDCSTFVVCFYYFSLFERHSKIFLKLPFVWVMSLLHSETARSSSHALLIWVYPLHDDTIRLPHASRPVSSS